MNERMDLIKLIVKEYIIKYNVIKLKEIHKNLGSCEVTLTNKKIKENG